MKQLSIEEKAKRYDEALEKANNTIEVNQAISDIVECVESLFPELAESEGERIRKYIVEAVELHKDFTQGRKERIYAWLEKQKERNTNTHLPSFDEAQGTPIVKQGEQNPWSEEDEQYLLVCKNALAKYQTTDKWDAHIIFHWLENKLKSLRPQNRWKPSEEQLYALRSVVTKLKHSDNKCQETIEDLYYDLEKLKEK